MTDLVPRERSMPLKESLEQRAEDYRFRLGPVRLSPRLGIGSLTYDKYIATEDTAVEDWRATLVAGASFVARVGSKMWLDGTAEANYDWYAEQADRRRLGGTYEGAATVFLGRLTLRGNGGFVRASGQATSETEFVFDQEDRFAGAQAEYELLRRLSLLATWASRDVSFPTEGLGEVGSVVAQTQDRTDETWRFGVRYQFSPLVSIGAVLEGSRTDFENRTDITKSVGRGALATVSYERPRFLVNVGGGVRRYEWTKETGEETPTAPAGAAFISYDLTRRVQLQLYGDLGDVASIFRDGGIFQERRLGAGVVLPVGRIVKLSGFYETGRNAYYDPVTLPDGSRLDRKDLLDRMMVRTDVAVGRVGSIGVWYERTWYDSNVPGTARSVERITVSLLAGIGLFTPGGARR